MKTIILHQNKLKLYYCIIIVLIIIGILSFLIYEFQLLSYPYDWEQTEGDHLNYASLISKGQPIYSDNNQLPMLFILYPPGYHILYASLIKIFGETLLIGRIISLLSIVLIILIIYWVIVSETNNKKLALISSGIFLSSKLIMSQLPFGRVNALYISLTLLGIYLVWKMEKTNEYNWYYYLIISLIFMISIYTKQLAMIPFLLCIIYLLFKKPLTAIIITSLTFIFSLLTLILLQYLTKGWFINNIITIPSAQSSYGFRFILGMVFFAFINCIILFILAIMSTIDSLRKSKKISIWTIYLFSGMMIIMLFGWNSGATEDYIAPFMIATIICAAIFYNQLSINWKIIVIPFIILQIIIQISLFGIFYDNIDTKYKQNALYVANRISNTTGDVLTERFVTFNIKANKKVWVEASVLKLLENSSVWDDYELTKSIQNHKYTLILANCNKPFGNQEISDSVLNYYIKEDNIELRAGRNAKVNLCWYTPKIKN